MEAVTPAPAQATSQTPALSRLDGVDTLRGLSILAVILLHIWIRFSFVHVHLARDWPQYTYRLFFNGGNGVTVFFAISGFLITLTSLRRFDGLGNMRPTVFYRIRFARIMPLLLLLLAVLSALHLAHVDGFVISPKFFTLPRAVLSALTFHLNWLEAARNAWLPACWTVLWSLSIEEMFYLFFPLACVLLWRRRFGKWPWGAWVWIALALALIACGPPARTVWSPTDLWKENSYLAGMASIALGCLTALLTDRASRRNLPRRLLNTLQLLGWFLVALVAIWPRSTILHFLGKTGLDDTLVALAACVVIFATTLRAARGRPWTAPLRWFGRHSYELYLSHEFIVILGVELFARKFPHGASRPTVALFVVAIILATAPLAWALARFFSEPANRWLRGAAPPR